MIDCPLFFPQTTKNHNGNSNDAVKRGQRAEKNEIPSVRDPKNALLMRIQFNRRDAIYRACKHCAVGE